MTPTPRTEPAVLALFVGRVLRQSPHRRYLIDGLLLVAAIAAARAGRN